MMKTAFTIFCAALLASLAFSQNAVAPATFELASVRVSPPGWFLRARTGPTTVGSGFRLLNGTMIDLISTAYGVDAARIVDGPNWLEWDHYDVVGQMPAGASAGDEKAMLGTLLAARFGLKAHNDTRPVLAYALIAGKTLKIRQSDGSGEGGCKTSMQNAGRGGAPGDTGLVSVQTCHNMTMENFAQSLRKGITSPYLSPNVPVVDSTGLKGGWDFVFQVPLRFGSANGLPGMLEDQLGLGLVAEKTQVQVLVVDSADRKPAGDAPGAAEKLNPGPPTAFEVADVKPVDPAARTPMMPRFTASGLTLQLPMSVLVDTAFSLDFLSTIIGAPAWMTTARFDINAKLPAGSPPAPSRLDSDYYGPLLRALLEDRFALKTHWEDRVLPAWTLENDKPKMRVVHPERTRLVTVQNLTMAQFAERLQGIAPGGLITSPVLDATGLNGSWDFTLNFRRCDGSLPDTALWEATVPLDGKRTNRRSALLVPGGLSLPGESRRFTRIRNDKEACDPAGLTRLPRSGQAVFAASYNRDC